MSRSFASVLLVLLMAGVARAGDGRLEIHQACVATGCFPGDAPGFPVQTASHQSYVLTSGLVVPDANTTAILLAERAALDPNGFAIEGVTSCGASPTLCTNTGTGVGIEAFGGAVIRNGKILKIGGDGILGAGVHGNGGYGVSGFRIHFTNNAVSRNAQQGLYAGLADRRRRQHLLVQQRRQRQRPDRRHADPDRAEPVRRRRLPVKEGGAGPRQPAGSAPNAAR